MKGNIKLFFILIGQLLLIEVLFILCRVWFFLYNAEFFSEIAFPRFVEICLFGLRFDIAVIVLVNAPFIFLALVPFEIRFNRIYRTILKAIFYCVNALALLVDIVDCVYYRFTLERSSFNVINQFKNESNWLNLALNFSFDYWYFIIFWMSLIFVLVVVYSKIENQLSRPNNIQLFSIINIVVSPIIIYVIIFVSKGSLTSKNDLLSVRYASNFANRPKEVSLIINTPFSLIYPKNTEEEFVTFFSSERDLRNNYDPVHHYRDSSDFRKKNVVIIILESFSKEFVGFFNRDLDGGQYKGYTPFLDSLISESKAFKYSIANGRKSIEAMPSVLCSIPSLDAPYVISRYADNKVNSLPSLLQKKNYTSAFFHGGANGSMGFQKFALICGFNQYFGRNEYNNDKDYDGTWGIWDDKFLQFTANKIASLKEPFFATVFTVTSHYPYKIPLEYKKKFEWAGNNIYQSIAYSDYSLKQFFKSIARLPSFENTLFVITADHAASVINHSEYSTPIGYFEIPIFFYSPNGDVRGYSFKTIQQIDIMPTILNYLDYNEPYIAFGNDAFDDSQEGLSVNYLDNVYHAYYQNYLLQFDGEKATGLFQFHDDKSLKCNQLQLNPEVAKLIETKLKGFIQQYKNRMISDSLYVTLTH
jgi:phosphoglycerol transferase MdoB-like AlkP superfamily enzyme